MEAFTLVDVGFGMILATVAYAFVSRHQARARAEHVEWVSRRPQLTGVVERLKEFHGEDTTYVPLIVYTLPDGQRYAIDGESSRRPEPPVGMEIEIAYEPSSPSTARIVRPSSLFDHTSVGDVIGFVVVTFLGTLLATFVRWLIG